MDDRRSEPPDAAPGEEPIVVGLLAAPGLTHDLAKELAPELPALLRKRFPEVEWEVVVEVEALAGAVGFGVDLVQVARRRMLSGNWKLVVCLTDLPLHVGRRPVTAYASAALGVGLVSVPALGVVAVETRVRRAVLRLVEGLLGESVARHEHAGDDRPRRTRMRRRLRELAFPVGRAYVQDDRTVRFVTATGRGNLRLLAGMVRANRPWQLVVGLSRTLVAALGTAAFGLVSPGVWLLAGSLGWRRQVALFLGSAVATCVTLIIAHRLWEPVPSREVRERVVLFNLATALTITLGVLTLFLALVAINLVSGVALIAPQRPRRPAPPRDRPRRLPAAGLAGERGGHGRQRVGCRGGERRGRPRGGLRLPPGPARRDPSSRRVTVVAEPAARVSWGRRRPAAPALAHHGRVGRTRAR